jgi:hypothetical protein
MQSSPWPSSQLTVLGPHPRQRRSDGVQAEGVDGAERVGPAGFRHAERLHYRQIDTQEVLFDVGRERRRRRRESRAPVQPQGLLDLLEDDGTRQTVSPTVAINPARDG